MEKIAVKLFQIIQHLLADRMVELRLLKERLQMLCGDEALRAQLTLERIGTVIQLDRIARS